MKIDGRALAKAMREDVKIKLSQLESRVKIVALMMGEDASAESYLKMLKKSCESVGFSYEILRLSTAISQEEVLSILNQLNEDLSVGGIIVQMPLPDHLDENRIHEAIVPHKDVDGFNPVNSGRLFKGEPSMVPCTALAVMKTLDFIDYDLQGKHVVIVGRSNIVGKPLFHLMLQRSATVTVCHSKTQDLQKILKTADVVIMAIGRKNFLKADMVKEGVVVMDVGINYEGGKLYGDVDFENVSPLASYITPVPGGIGPVTNACLMLNTLNHYSE